MPVGRITLHVVSGLVGSSDFATEVLVVGLPLTDAGPGAGRVAGGRYGRELDLVHVLVPVGPQVPRGAESSEETEEGSRTALDPRARLVTLRNLKKLVKPEGSSSKIIPKGSSSDPGAYHKWQEEEQCYFYPQETSPSLGFDSTAKQCLPSE